MLTCSCGKKDQQFFYADKRVGNKKVVYKIANQVQKDNFTRDNSYSNSADKGFYFAPGCPFLA